MFFVTSSQGFAWPSGEAPKPSADVVQDEPGSSAACASAGRSYKRCRKMLPEDSRAEDASQPQTNAAKEGVSEQPDPNWLAFVIVPGSWQTV